MRVIVKFRGIAPSADIRHHAERQLRLHLSRFGEELRVATVRLSDTNGPRGGIDKLCQLTLRGRAIGVLTIRELRAELHAAIDVAADRAQRTVARELAHRHASGRTVGLRRMLDRFSFGER